RSRCGLARRRDHGVARCACPHDWSVAAARDVLRAHHHAGAQFAAAAHCGGMMVVYEPRAVAGGGWRLALPQQDASYVVLTALDPELDHGTLRATVVLLRDTAGLTKDRLNLTRAQSRKIFVETVATDHKVTVPEGALLALEMACRQTATVRHVHAAAESGPDAGDGALSTDDPVAGASSTPPLALAPL